MSIKFSYLNQHKSYAYIGKNLKRTDVLDKVTGRGKFTADLKFSNMLYGKLIRSTEAHARILKIDTSEAENCPELKQSLLPKMSLQRNTVSALHVTMKPFFAATRSDITVIK